MKKITTILFTLLLLINTLVVLPKQAYAFSATGGTITTSGAYTIHTFTTTGQTFTPSGAGTVDVLVVAGGGSGGNHSTSNGNGGGGGGGVIYSASFAVTAQAYTVTVGNGGIAIANATASVGNNGQNSVFSTLTAYGGGGGGTTNGTGGQNGGSGGGSPGNCYGAGAATQPGSASGGFGNAGGACSNTLQPGGGGGGAGSAGAAGNVSPGGNGGTGYSSAISGTTKYYAGGGGGGGNSSERAGDGFDGGGRGEGTTTYYGWTTYTTEVNATTRGSGIPTAIVNTGGGGGGGSYYAANGGWSTGSGAGGSGIVIIRYAPVAPTITTPTNTSITTSGATLGGNVTSDGGATVTGRGVCVGTSSNPAIGGTCFTTTGTTGVFTVAATSLSSGTLYHYRAYATNSIGTSYTTDDSFTTVAILAPTITTPTQTSIGGATATLGGNVTSDGGGTITGRGVCVGTSSNPALGGTCFTTTGTTGVFTVSATGLTQATFYHYRAYATNSIGTSYATDDSFTTQTITAPTVVVSAETNVDSISTTLNGTVNPGYGVTSAWYMWGTSNVSCFNLPNSTASQSLGSGASPVALTAAIGGFSPGATYYYCIVSTNASGVTYGNVASLTQVSASGCQSVSLAGDYTASSSCVLGNSTNDGVDVGTGTQNNAYLNLAKGTTFTVGAGQTVAFGFIYKPGATIVMLSGGSLRRSAIWVADTDGDGYPDNPGTQGEIISATQPVGYVRRATAGNNSVDCAPNDNTKFKNYTSYVDVDGDGYTSTAIPSLICGGNTLIGGAPSSLGVDCNDASATVQENKTTYTDADSDGYSGGTGATVCVSHNTGAAVSCSTGYSKNASGTCLLTASLGADCNDTNAYVYQNVSVAPDTDQDGYSTSGASTACVGANSTVSGRTYYKDSSNAVTQIDSASILGTTDCASSDATKWQNLTGYADVDADGYGTVSSSQICSGAALPSGYVSNNDDCDDTNASIILGSTRTRYQALTSSCGTYSSGSESQSCQTHGVWSGTYTLSSPPSASTRTMYQALTSACGTYSSGSESQSCQSNGAWTGSYALSSPPSASTRTGQLTTSVGCGTACQNQTQTCQSNGSWNGSGSASCTASTRTMYLASCAASCSSEGQSCQSNGAWSGSYTNGSCSTAQTTYYQDADNDGYGSPSVTTASCTGAPGGYITNNTDCYDGNASAHPGATGTYYTYNRGDGSFDYNCDGISTRQYAGTYANYAQYYAQYSPYAYIGSYRQYSGGACYNVSRPIFPLNYCTNNDLVYATCGLQVYNIDMTCSPSTAPYAFEFYAGANCASTVYSAASYTSGYAWFTMGCY